MERIECQVCEKPINIEFMEDGQCPHCQTFYEWDYMLVGDGDEQPIIIFNNLRDKVKKWIKKNPKFKPRESNPDFIEAYHHHIAGLREDDGQIDSKWFGVMFYVDRFQAYYRESTRLPNKKSYTIINNPTIEELDKMYANFLALDIKEDDSFK